jgi:hypothetical protein
VPKGLKEPGENHTGLSDHRSTIQFVFEDLIFFSR